MNPKRRRFDPRIAEENVRKRVAEGLRRLAALGFVEAIEDGRVRLRPALLRFAEPARGGATPEKDLERLLSAGEFALREPDAPDDERDDDAEEAE
jgi:chromosome partition protein MukE